MRDRLCGADLVHRLLADLGCRFAGGATGQRPAGVSPAADQARPDLRRQRPHGAGAKPQVDSRCPDDLHPPVPIRRIVRPGGRIQHRRPGPHRHRALLQRLPDVLQCQPLDRAAEPRRLAAGSHHHRRQPDHQPLGTGPAGGHGGPRSDARRRGRDPAVDRAGAGDGLHADLQPQPRGGQLPQAEPHRLRRAASEPGHAGPVHPRLDVQDGHRHGRAQEPQVHAQRRR